MKIYNQINIMSNILAALTLFLLMGWSLTAKAEDNMPTTDLAAPCGELHIIGAQSFIFNRSNFTVNVKFKTNASHNHRYSINAGAVKYLERDANGNSVWRDTGVGDYRTSKTYTVPVKSNDVVTIAYCASEAAGLAVMTGIVSFTGDASEPGHKIPDGNVAFEGRAGYVEDNRGDYYQTESVLFQPGGNVVDVAYNVNPTGIVSYGSMTICPENGLCSFLPPG